MRIYRIKYYLWRHPPPPPSKNSQMYIHYTFGHSCATVCTTTIPFGRFILMLVPLIKINFYLPSALYIISINIGLPVCTSLHQALLSGNRKPTWMMFHVGFFMLPPNWFQVGFLYNIFLYRSLRNPPRSADPHGLYLSRLQKLIGSVHTASQHISDFFWSDQSVIAIKHNGKSSFGGLL